MLNVFIAFSDVDGQFTPENRQVLISWSVRKQAMIVRSIVTGQTWYCVPEKTWVDEDNGTFNVLTARGAHMSLGIYDTYGEYRRGNKPTKAQEAWWNKKAYELQEFLLSHM